MKLAHLVATVFISCCVAAHSQAGVVIGGSYGIAPGKGKPVVTSEGSLNLDLVSEPDQQLQHLQPTASSSTLAAGFTIPGVISHLTHGTLTSGMFNVYNFTVSSCIDSFVSSVLFDEEIVGLNFLNGSSAGLGLFVLGVEGKRLTFAGYSPFNKGFTLEIYTANTPDAPDPIATATPEPSALLMWGGMVALCGVARSLHRLY